MQRGSCLYGDRGSWFNERVTLPVRGAEATVPSIERLRLAAADLEIKTLGKPRIESPVAQLLGKQALHFVGGADKILLDNRVSSVKNHPAEEPLPGFELAGPRDCIFFDPSKARCGIVTCGGICPGLNNVVRGLVNELTLAYGVRTIYGFRYGFQGFIARFRHKVMDLTPETVMDINEHGGTILGSSRGEQDPEEIVDCLERMGIGVLFVIGGDGTIRGAMAIARVVKERQLKIAVVGIPKTIDNDIPFIERSFGFETAFTEGGRVIRSAHAEARACHNGVGLVKLMGRHSGFIACHAALAQTDADFVLIPEVPFTLEGPHSFLQALERRLREQGHAVIVVAEGAGQEHIQGEGEERDASGNLKLRDIGVLLRQAITGHFRERGQPLNLKYIDPSYEIRSVPASPSDSVYCWSLARNAVHAAMCGNTEMVIGYWQGHFVHVPMGLAASGRKQVDPTGPLWLSVLESTGRPADFQ